MIFYVIYLIKKIYIYISIKIIQENKRKRHLPEGRSECIPQTVISPVERNYKINGLHSNLLIPDSVRLFSLQNFNLLP